jgi:hypothetical protein
MITRHDVRNFLQKMAQSDYPEPGGPKSPGEIAYLKREKEFQDMMNKAKDPVSLGALPRGVVHPGLEALEKQKGVGAPDSPTTKEVKTKIHPSTRWKRDDGEYKGEGYGPSGIVVK